ncbi:MAG: hypothetical protein ACMXYG_02790, partial [Candidatus Woesearchaeota archaeon]
MNNKFNNKTFIIIFSFLLIYILNANAVSCVTGIFNVEQGFNQASINQQGTLCLKGNLYENDTIGLQANPDGIFNSLYLSTPLARFYSSGDLRLKGECRVRPTCESGSFNVISSTGTILASLDYEGNLCMISGDCGKLSCWNETYAYIPFDDVYRYPVASYYDSNVKACCPFEDDCVMPDGTCRRAGHCTRTTGFTEYIDSFYLNESTNYSYRGTMPPHPIVDGPTEKNISQFIYGVNDNIMIYHKPASVIVQDYYIAYNTDCNDFKFNHINDFKGFYSDCFYNSNFNPSSIRCKIYAYESFDNFNETISVYGCVKIDGIWNSTPEERFIVYDTELCPEGKRLCENFECQEDCDIICPIGPDPSEICMPLEINVYDEQGYNCRNVTGELDCDPDCFPSCDDPDCVGDDCVDCFPSCDDPDCVGDDCFDCEPSCDVEECIGDDCFDCSPSCDGPYCIGADCNNCHPSCDDENCVGTDCDDAEEIIIEPIICPLAPDPFNICVGVEVVIYDSIGNPCRIVEGTNPCHNIFCPPGPKPYDICSGEIVNVYDSAGNICRSVFGTRICLHSECNIYSIPDTICKGEFYYFYNDNNEVCHAVTGNDDCFPNIPICPSSNYPSNLNINSDRCTSGSFDV